MRPRESALTLGILFVLAACQPPAAAPPGPATAPGAMPPGSTSEARVVQQRGFQPGLRGEREAVISFLPRVSTTVESSVLNRVNRMRMERRNQPLTLDPKLVEAAREHSWAMAIARRGFLTAPDGKGIEDRLRASGATYGLWYGYAWGPINVSEPQRMAIDILLNLDRNVLQGAGYRRIGVAVYRRSSQVYTTVVFAD